jgi:cellulose synthase/poly-beta-1,6-N-acetylglucosamine synthase-like glycosyltransferase
MGAPAISVLLPARDAQDTLERAARSILAQSLSDLELVLVDDGSQDDTPRLLGRLAQEDCRVTVVRTYGLGLVGALNLGLEACRAPLLARMDADDEAHPRRLEAQARALAQTPLLWGVGTQVELFREDRPPSPNMQLYIRWLNSLVEPARLHQERFIESPLCHPSVMLRREVLERVGGWREGPFPEDYELWLRLLEHGPKLAVVPEVLLRWRDHDRRLTRTDPRYAPSAFSALKATYLARGPLSARPAVVWGAGPSGLAMFRRLKAAGVTVKALLEVSARKIGQRIEGVPVLAPDAVDQRGDAHLVVAVGAKGAREEIRAFLSARGLTEGPDYTCAA